MSDDMKIKLCSSSSRSHQDDDLPPVSHIVPIFSSYRDRAIFVPCFCHPFRDVTTEWRLTSSKPSLPIHFPLNRTFHRLAPAISDYVAKEVELAGHNTS